MTNLRFVEKLWGIFSGRKWVIPEKERNFYYITMLRDPVSRYLSEWKHVQRGATWKTSLHMCDGRSPTPDELPTCYEGDDWSGVSLQEFMDCSYNLANNRQVRMLADLSLVGCYNLTFMNESERNMILLLSAKNNLKNMAFFGLTEFQRKTQYLFERTFNLKFISPFTQFNVTRASNVDIGEDVRQRIEELNFLDVQLYEYAKDLFLQRFQYSKQEEHQKNRLKRREERRLLREQRGHQWPREEAAEAAVTEDYNSQEHAKNPGLVLKDTKAILSPSSPSKFEPPGLPSQDPGLATPSAEGRVNNVNNNGFEGEHESIIGTEKGRLPSESTRKGRKRQFWLKDYKSAASQAADMSGSGVNSTLKKATATSQALKEQFICETSVVILKYAVSVVEQELAVVDPVSPSMINLCQKTLYRKSGGENHVASPKRGSEWAPHATEESQITCQ
ncbi:hypothetical protein Q9966_004819 [Columba livia]|nr:hypothetical protein Q9966_004819 [Columba livia]